MRYCGHTERLFQYHYPNHNFSHQPNPNPDPHPNPNPNTSRQERNIRLAGWSRDQISFSPITSQGSIFTLRHVGWFGISEQKYVDQHLEEIIRTWLQKILKHFGERFSESDYILLINLFSEAKYYKAQCLAFDQSDFLKIGLMVWINQNHHFLQHCTLFLTVPQNLSLFCLCIFKKLCIT